ncbi:MAG: 6-phosphofructokinase [Bacteroidaceae bacterium]|nr:6-phosphofructokinase [Bacteroidaceae bacterium]
MLKTIALMTSGNDAPGMNSAIRAVTRSAIYNGLRVKAVRRGYKGLIDGDIVEFQTQNVSNIIQQGGTILKSSPSKDFFSEEGRQKAYENLQREEVDALVVIGGDGTIHGARIFAQEHDIPCIAIPATIDNNLCGTDTTIGYDTALNTIMQCVDKIRDTASSHERLFFVEVMGDDAGFLALNGAIASGCEEAIIPTAESHDDRLTEYVQNGFRKTKSSSIVLVAASEEYGGAMKYAEQVRKTCPDIDVRISILGHLQRGGHPSAHDRIIASRMGSAAIEALRKGLRNVMIGIDNDEIVYVPFSRAVKENRRIDHDLLNILHDVAI